jgi:arabinose-5-phosphate isomerase
MHINTPDQIKRILELEIKGIQDCLKLLQKEPYQGQFQKAIDLLFSALQKKAKIILIGVGKSGNLAHKITATLNSSGSQSVFLHPTDALHGDSGIIKPHDVIWSLSYSGNTPEVVQCVKIIKNLYPSIAHISMSSHAHSELTQLSDAWISLPRMTEACPYNMVPTTSTTAILAVADTVALILMQKNQFTPKDFAVFHPAGSLGKKLHQTVKQIMQKKTQCSFVGPKEDFHAVLKSSTEKRLGVALVVNEKTQLLGIITDGDIRRHLLASKKPLLAEKIMQKKPITITADTLIYDALQLMEKRESPISVLPVVDKNKRCLGVVRLHDILKEI